MEEKVYDYIEIAKELGIKQSGAYQKIRRNISFYGQYLTKKNGKTVMTQTGLDKLKENAHKDELCKNDVKRASVDVKSALAAKEREIEQLKADVEKWRTKYEEKADELNIKQEELNIERKRITDGVYSYLLNTGQIQVDNVEETTDLSINKEPKKKWKWPWTKK